MFILLQVRSLDDASIFFLAGLPKEVYEVVEKVFTLFSRCQLKGQKSKRGGLGKPLDLKGNNFKPLRGLECNFVKELLGEVAEGEKMLAEMAAYCDKVKKLKNIQRSFMEEVGITNWDEVSEKFPSFCSAEALDEFTTTPNVSQTPR